MASPILTEVVIALLEAIDCEHRLERRWVGCRRHRRKEGDVNGNRKVEEWIMRT
jgi:hypothetical protein